MAKEGSYARSPWGLRLRLAAGLLLILLVPGAEGAESCQQADPKKNRQEDSNFGRLAGWPAGGAPQFASAGARRSEIREEWRGELTGIGKSLGLGRSGEWPAGGAPQLASAGTRRSEIREGSRGELAEIGQSSTWGRLGGWPAGGAPQLASAGARRSEIREGSRGALTGIGKSLGLGRSGRWPAGGAPQLASAGARRQWLSILKVLSPIPDSVGSNRPRAVLGHPPSLGLAFQEPPEEPEPELPVGLGEPEEPQPDLPTGLGEPEPDLPAGLGEPQDPELPPGLEEPKPPGGLDGPQEPELPSGLGEEPDAPSRDEGGDGPRWLDKVRLFADVRAGHRLQTDPDIDDDLPLAEARIQVAFEQSWGKTVFDARLDGIYDAVDEELREDVRQVRLSLRPTSSTDLRIGRQILSWGTGDLLFINDLFPKDWRAFFTGRDTEYLKVPSDALRGGWHTRRGSLEVVYTPQFDPDRFLTGERVSFFNPQTGGRVGSAVPLEVDRPDRWFEDDEIALRFRSQVGSAELAAYGYYGFWKSPGGFDPDTGKATFPRLAVYGASLRSPLGPGVASFEVGLYDSLDDRCGCDLFVANGQFRALVGFERELAQQFTGGLQLYTERTTDHGADRRTRELAGAGPGPDEWRTVTTLRLRKTLRRDTLALSLFTFYSPSDEDGYLRPSLRFDLSDRWRFEVGGNHFFGQGGTTFFSQLEPASNFYTAWRYTR